MGLTSPEPQHQSRSSPRAPEPDTFSSLAPKVQFHLLCPHHPPKPRLALSPASAFTPVSRQETSGAGDAVWALLWLHGLTPLPPTPQIIERTESLNRSIQKRYS